LPRVRVRTCRNAAVLHLPAAHEWANVVRNYCCADNMANGYAALFQRPAHIDRIEAEEVLWSCRSRGPDAGVEEHFNDAAISPASHSAVVPTVKCQTVYPCFLGQLRKRFSIGIYSCFPVHIFARRSPIRLRRPDSPEPCFETLLSCPPLGAGYAGTKGRNGESLSSFSGLY
jgi:hypothetical protein